MLILIAQPPMLGLLRNNLDAKIDQHILAAIAKDVAQHDASNILKLLQSHQH